MKVDQASTIMACVEHYAQVQPDSPAYRFLPKGRGQQQVLSYQQLHDRAQKLACHLIARQLRHERAILLFPAGLEFMVALFGCFHAGTVAIPSNLSRNSQHIQRLKGIIDDAKAAVILTTPELEAGLKAQLDRHDITFITVSDQQSETDAPDVIFESPQASDLAFIQYTSGSTSAPKGVMVDHHNLISNIIAIRDTFGTHEKITIGGWIPQFHDMGLIGHILHAAAVGGHYVFMSPLTFIQRPLRWLQLMDNFKCELSTAPNFAYDLCVKKITPEQIANLNLSHWQWAGNGAEPVQAETIEAFCTTFAEAGLKPTVMTPCYGMAETTLMVSSSTNHHLPECYTVCAESLSRGLLQETTVSNVPTQILVGCGTVAANHQVLIVEPDSCQVLKDGQIGEIWVKGPSVAKGYWNKPEKTRQDFAAYTCCGEGPYLRTGDIGTLWQQQLVLSGRLKDLIIICGRNLYPQDLERSLSSASPLVRLNKAAAFTVNQQLILVQELEKGTEKHPDFSTLKNLLNRQITAEYNVIVHDIVFIRANSLPMTSSGKVQRSLCSKLYEQQQLQVVRTAVAALA